MRADEITADACQVAAFKLANEISSRHQVAVREWVTVEFVVIYMTVVRIDLLWVGDVDGGVVHNGHTVSQIEPDCSTRITRDGTSARVVTKSLSLDEPIAPTVLSLLIPTSGRVIAFIGSRAFGDAIRKLLPKRFAGSIDDRRLADGFESGDANTAQGLIVEMGDA